MANLFEDMEFNPFNGTDKKEPYETTTVITTPDPFKLTGTNASSSAEDEHITPNPFEGMEHAPYKGTGEKEPPETKRAIISPQEIKQEKINHSLHEPVLAWESISYNSHKKP